MHLAMQRDTVDSSHALTYRKTHIMPSQLLAAGQTLAYGRQEAQQPLVPLGSRETLRAAAALMLHCTRPWLACRAMTCQRHSMRAMGRQAASPQQVSTHMLPHMYVLP